MTIFLFDQKGVLDTVTPERWKRLFLQLHENKHLTGVATSVSFTEKDQARLGFDKDDFDVRFGEADKGRLSFYQHVVQICETEHNCKATFKDIVLVDDNAMLISLTERCGVKGHLYESFDKMVEYFKTEKYIM